MKAAPLKFLTIALSAGPAYAQAPPSSDPVPVTVTQAVRQDVPVFARGIGTVQAFQSVLIRARVDGTLERIAFREGQQVKPGDLLATIDPRPYAATLAQAQARRAADAAQLANAQLDLARYANLARSNFTSRQQLDGQRATVGQDAANLQGDDANIASAALNLSFCTIASPIEGVVGLRLVDAGNLVHATDTQGIVSITQIHPISLVFTLPQDLLPQVHTALAQGAAPRVIAVGSEDNVPLSEGTLLTTSNIIDTQSGTIALKAEFANQDDHLWPGQFTAARLQLRVEKNAVTVPPSAVQHGPDGLYVYLVKPDQTVQRQDIKAGYEDDNLAVVAKGLNGGETVVVSGQMRLQAGTRVAARALAAKS